MRKSTPKSQNVGYPPPSGWGVRPLSGPALSGVVAVVGVVLHALDLSPVLKGCLVVGCLVVGLGVGHVLLGHETRLAVEENSEFRVGRRGVVERVAGEGAHRGEKVAEGLNGLIGVGHASSMGDAGR